jgi:hypothetical protein
MVMDKIFLFDNTTGYRWGMLIWLSFFIPSFVVLCVDQTPGPSRDYLTYGSLFSVVALIIYSYYFYEGRPASTPSQIAMLADGLARWILAAHLGPNIIVHGNTPIGVMNGILLVMSGLFVLMKLGTQLYINFNLKSYLEYEKKMIVTV